jgi:glycoprotein-N-acetylgalactosamine 3-beta-galactosyltransferase
MDNNLTTNASHEFIDPFPILQPAMHQIEVYGKLTDKVYKTIRDLYLRYNDYDWYLKADDDTFIFVDNLKTFLKTKNSSHPVTYGFDFRTIVDRGYHSGGAGYVLSNEALQRIGLKLTENVEYCPNSGTEDVDIAKCLRKLGVYPEKSIDEKGRERFHPFDVATHLLGGFPDWYFQYASNPVQKGIESCSETSISFHYMSPYQIQKLYTLYNDVKRHNRPFNFTSMLYQMII